MITTDLAAQQQGMGMLMNRNAEDKEPMRAQEGSWEAISGTPLVPRRSPWVTQYEDSESLNPVVSNSQVPATTKNIADLAYMFSGGATSGSGVSTPSISESSLISAVTQPAVIAAIVAALPIIDFKCPE
jgi:hypothetical protein